MLNHLATKCNLAIHTQMFDTVHLTNWVFEEANSEVVLKK